MKQFWKNQGFIGDQVLATRDVAGAWGPSTDACHPPPTPAYDLLLTFDADHLQAAMEGDPAFAPLLVNLMASSLNQPPMLLRLAFTLGNLTTHSDGYRRQVRACSHLFCLF